MRKGCIGVPTERTKNGQRIVYNRVISPQTSGTTDFRVRRMTG